ncbi:MAG: type II toxin-antitoxin system RelE family toxin [Thermoplasmatota archaeon]
MFRVLLEPAVERELRHLVPEIRARFYRAFEMLERDPFRSRPLCDIRSVKGQPGWRALRVGKFRAIYVVEGELVRVTRVAHRKSVYDR